MHRFIISVKKIEWLSTKPIRKTCSHVHSEGFSCCICEKPILVNEDYHDGSKFWNRGHVDCIKNYLESKCVDYLPDTLRSTSVKQLKELQMTQIFTTGLVNEKFMSRFGFSTYEDYLKKEKVYLESCGRIVEIVYSRNGLSCSLYANDLTRGEENGAISKA